MEDYNEKVIFATNLEHEASLLWFTIKPFGVVNQ